MPTDTEMITPQTETHSYLLQHLRIPNVSTSHSTTHNPPRPTHCLPITYPSRHQSVQLPTRYLHRAPSISSAPVMIPRRSPPAGTLHQPPAPPGKAYTHLTSGRQAIRAMQARAPANHWARSRRLACKCYVTGERECGRWEAWGVGGLASLLVRVVVVGLRRLSRRGLPGGFLVGSE
jgi:hypothetical protein